MGGRRMRLAQVAAGVLVGVAVLAGCSSKEPANDTLPTPSATSAEASETLPPLGPADFPMPAEAREKDAVGAKAFLFYYVELLNRAQSTLNAENILDLSQECATCTAFAEGIESYADKGYEYLGGSITLNDAATPTLRDRSCEFAISLSQGQLQVLGSGGAPVAELASAENTFPASGATLVWDRARSTWLMSDLTIA